MFIDNIIIWDNGGTKYIKIQKFHTNSEQLKF